MDDANLRLATQLVSRTYVEQGGDALRTRRKLIKTLLSQRRLPAEGWDEETIELFLKDVSLMDSNNFVKSVGVGEREARVASSLVYKRHFGLAHGIGRSGDVAAEQPKAAGSSLLAKLCNILVQDALSQAGMLDVGAVTVLPVATGMALTLALLALKARRPATARYVLWPRIDQKTCLKAVVSANLEIVPLADVLDKDELHTDMAAIQQEINRLGPNSIVCIVTTTSCFAPRAADSVVEVAKLCQTLGIGHIVNNAYGVQSAALCALVTAAWRKGRVDAVVQSTDKNFMVPVGGAVIAAPKHNTALVEAVNKAYPGRASMSPLLDVLITLLQWGVRGWRGVLQQREEVYRYALEELGSFAETIGERALHTPGNPISIGMTISRGRALTGPSLEFPVLAPGQGPCTAGPQHGVSAHHQAEHVEPVGRSATGEESAAFLAAEHAPQSEAERGAQAQQRQLQHSTGADSRSEHSAPARTADGSAAIPSTLQDSRDGVLSASSAKPLSMLGAMLFKRGVSGTRVVAQGKVQSIAGHEFQGYGAHHDSYPHTYLTFAAALGTTKQDVDEFLRRLRLCLEEFRRRS